MYSSSIRTGHVGGPDRFVTNLVRYLTIRGWQFWIVLSKERPLAHTLHRLGVSVVILPSLQTLPAPSHRLIWLATLSELGQPSNRRRL